MICNGKPLIFLLESDMISMKAALLSAQAEYLIKCVKHKTRIIDYAGLSHPLNAGIKGNGKFMWLDMNVCGINVQLRIKGYKISREEDWDSQWCKCDFVFRSGDWLNYHKEDDEVLLSREIEELEMSLTKLLNDELEEKSEFQCMEPDFCFILHPKRDLRKDPNIIYVQKGYEIADIYMEWEVYFWDEGLTDNHLTVTFDRDEIILLRDYLSSVIRGK